MGMQRSPRKHQQMLHQELSHSHIPLMLHAQHQQLHQNSELWSLGLATLTFIEVQFLCGMLARLILWVSF